MSLEVENCIKSGSLTRGRFAPSPSGRMHLGNIYTALAAWLFVRKNEGEFILRIEDLDPSRCPRDYAALIIDDLKWLGLDWDNEEIIYQSEREETYKRYFSRLQEEGLLYPCFCSRAQLHTASAPHASDGRVVYPGTCRELAAAEIARKKSERSPAARLILPNEEIAFTDEIYGKQRFNLQKDWGDIIVRRSDGVFAYQLAVSIDDGEAGVNQVVRGRDLMSSSAPQLFILQHFGFETPQYIHLPMLIAEDGSRLSKREKAVDMGFLREETGKPEKLLAYLAFILGQTEKIEEISLKELLLCFNAKKVPRYDIIIPREYWRVM